MSWDITQLGSISNKAVGKQIAGAPVTPTQPQAQATGPVLPTKLAHQPKPHAPDLAQLTGVSKRLNLAPIPFKKSWAAAAASGVVRTLEESAQVAELHQKATKLLDWIPPPDDVAADGYMLCAFCDASIPEPLWEELGRDALTGNITIVSNLCHWHRVAARTAEIEAGEPKWPSSINQALLPQRVTKLLPKVVVLVAQPITIHAFHSALEMWIDFGRKYCVSAFGLSETAKQAGYAYSYGHVGGSIIFAELMRAVKEGVIQLSLGDWRGITDEAYILQNILMPEVLKWLVMEDLEIGEAEALVVMEESKEYGMLGNTRLC
ncbi:hypothetical protein FRC12_020768 [Ceratobasidium sp. 428]|nr:hypothetical protein FRC12_020768 [Ceratobasidium sp. 428]